MDSNSHGTINLEEFERGVTGRGLKWDHLSMKEIFQVSPFDDFIGLDGYPFRPVTSSSCLTRQFFDGDSNGSIDFEELMQGLGGHAEGSFVQQRIEQLSQELGKKGEGLA